MDVKISVDEARFAGLVRKTQLDLRGVLDEALSIYARAVRAREDGHEIVVVDEANHSVGVLETGGLKNVKSDCHREAKPGDRMSDGTIFAGISPDTEEPVYTTAQDAPLTFTFNQARKYAAKLDAHSRHDWRVPTKRELDVLFNNRAAIGGFNQMDSGPSRWYRSSSQVDVIYVWWAQRFTTWAQRFSDGARHDFPKGAELSLRCVR